MASKVIMAPFQYLGTNELCLTSILLFNRKKKNQNQKKKLTNIDLGLEMQVKQRFSNFIYRQGQHNDNAIGETHFNENIPIISYRWICTIVIVSVDF